MDPFTLKKTLSLMLEPVCMFYLSLAAGLLLISSGRKKRGRLMASAGLVLLFLIGMTPVSGYFMARLERVYEPFSGPTDTVTHIAVLGASAWHDLSLPPLARLSHVGLARLVEGFRLYRKTPQAKVIFSGYRFLEDLSMAEMYAQAAAELGMDEHRMILLPQPRSTEEEALAIRAVVGERPFLLVTSALHMKRAMIIFKALGMSPIPAPADFMEKLTAAPFTLRKLVPNAYSILRFELMIHEYAGILWFNIKHTLQAS